MLLGTAALLASCGEPSTGRGDSAPPASQEPETATETRRVPEARADLEFGQFESAVGDLAAYESTPFGFQSLIFAANGAAGISVIRADGGEARVITPRGAPPYRLAVAYGDEAAGQLFVLDSGGGVSTFALPGGEEQAGNDLAYEGIEDICSNGAVVLGVGSGGARLLFGSDEGQDIAAGVPEGAAACEAAAGDFYVRDGEGWSRITPGGPEPTPLPAEAVTIVGTGEEVFALGVSGAEGALLVNGQPIRTLRADGSPLRPLEVEAAYGNLGGVTRDGAVIVLDELRRLYLLPWAEVATALGLPASLPSRRPEGEAAPGITGPALPEVRTEKPSFSFEERERPEAALPSPPGGGGR
jgi:hypothetical protein